MRPLTGPLNTSNHPSQGRVPNLSPHHPNVSRSCSTRSLNTLMESVNKGSSRGSIIWKRNPTTGDGREGRPKIMETHIHHFFLYKFSTWSSMSHLTASMIAHHTRHQPQSARRPKHAFIVYCFFLPIIKKSIFLSGIHVH